MPDDQLVTDLLVIGSGPGGAVTAMCLAEAGRDVLLIEEGPFLPLDSAAHFSRDEMRQKYRNGGITVGMGRSKIGYAEGRCAGGGSEINRGLYHRSPPSVLATWRRDFAVLDLDSDHLQPHFEACEQIARVSYLPGPAPAISQKLAEGASALGWSHVEVPRLFSYAADWQSAVPGTKQSMTETFIPRFRTAGGRLVCDLRADRLQRRNGRWYLQADSCAGGAAPRAVEVAARTVFVAGGAIQTPALLRRSGLKRRVGDSLAFHPMIKVVAQFPEPVNAESKLEPVHQVKEFDPRFSLGCSISKQPALVLAMIDRPESLPEIDRHWAQMAIYYVQSPGGRGTVRTLPGFRDPLVRVRHEPQDMRDLALGLKQLCTCLFAAGAEKIYPNLAGCPVLGSEADLATLPEELPPGRVSLTALHLLASCPMGEARARAVADSFGKVYDADDLYLADASMLCGSTIVNPQGTIMALAHRNVLHFLDGPRQ